MRKALLVVGAVVFGSLVVVLGTSVGGEREVRAAADPVLVGAGDIATCESRGDEATAKLLDDIRGTVITLGDNAYPDGTLSQFRNCYGPSWGRHKDRTKPARGQPRILHPGRGGLLRLLRRQGGEPQQGLLLLRAGRVARGGPQLQLLEGLRLRGGLGAGEVAQGRPRRPPQQMHPRLLPLPPLLQLRRSKATAPTCALLEGPLPRRRPKWCFPATTTTTSASPPRGPYGTLDRREGHKEFVVGTGGAHLPPFGTIKPTAGSGTAGPTGC